jgi:hypothetical protein
VAENAGASFFPLLHEKINEQIKQIKIILPIPLIILVLNRNNHFKHSTKLKDYQYAKTGIHPLAAEDQPLGLMHFPTEYLPDIHLSDIAFIK